MVKDTTTGFRLSIEQERVWVQQGETPYLARCIVLLRGALRPDVLQQAFTKVAAQQEILRTVYIRRPGLTMPFQVILDACPPAWNFMDLQGLDIANQDKEMTSLIAGIPTLNLEIGPVLHLWLVTLSENRHKLILTLPSLSADSRSLSNLIDEIGHTYVALISNSDHDTDLMQYVDIVQWQTDLLESEESKACRDFWRDYNRRLDVTALTPALLPFQITSQSTNFQPCIQSVYLDMAVASLLHKPDTEVRNVLLACWAVLIGRLTGSTNIAVGCALDGRKYEELENALGLFAKDVPLQINVDPTLRFSDLLRETKRSVAEANQWQEGFTWLPILGSDTKSQPIPVAFEYNEFNREQSFGDLSFEIIHQEVCRERFTLKLLAVQSAIGMTLAFHYDAAQLDSYTVKNFTGYYQTLLTAALEQPETQVGSLPLLSKEERNRLAIEWNETTASYPAQCIHQLFEAQARAFPHRSAVRCGDNVLSYIELNERSNQLAHYLRGIGVGPDSLVGLCVDRSVELLVGVLGILKAGGAYVPLNTDGPKQRLAQQLAGAEVLITEQKLLLLMPETVDTTICLDRDNSLWRDHPVNDPEVHTGLENLAYVLYTSGSTGVPKGVAVRHRNLVNYSYYIVKQLGLEGHPDGLQFATVSTIAADLGNTCIYPSLISGGCLHVIPYEIATDAKKFSDYGSNHPIDVLKIVPSHLHALLLAPEAQGVLPRRYLITGGEALTRNLVASIGELARTCEILNHYGPTETTVGSLTLLLRDFDWVRSPAATIPIGRPIANTQTYILDGLQQLVPPGVTGELYIAGGGVTAGYLNDSERSKERFVPNPFVNDPSARMYRTGDLARYHLDRNIEFLGRIDDQVKMRGFRIELGEIEAVLTANAAVKQATVIAREDEAGEKRLLAYVVPKSAVAISSENLRAHLKELLPDYMIPASIILLSKLPLGPNGKIDRLALPEPELVVAKTYVAPATPTEEVVSIIWAEVLRRERVSTADNFFELGGHSLLATQVISRIRRSLSVDVPLRSLFETPTVAAIAKQIDAAHRAPAIGEMPPITKVARDKDLPLSFAQQRLWVLDQMEPNNPLYNIPRRIRIHGDLDVNSLKRALNAIVERHESQRTTFAVHDDQPVQRIAPYSALNVRLQDLSDSPEASRLNEARRIAADEALISFNLSAGPLLRATLLKLAADDHILLLTMHHIVSDAWSAGVFFQEFSELYDSILTGRPCSLPELDIQYADYAVWQRKWYQGAVLNHQLTYWREHLRGAPTVLQLPSDRPRVKERTFHGSHETILFSAETARSLRNLGQHEGVTLFMSLLAGFQSLLMRYTGQEQIIVGTDVANRPTTETERLIGFFINLLALRTDLSGNPTFRELLGRVREVALGAYAHQDMPFDKLVEELQPERSLSHNPLVQVLFVMQNLPRQKRELSGMKVEPFDLPVTRSKFDLAVFVVDGDEDLTCHWVYSTDLFDKTAIERMAKHFERLLTSAVINPDSRVNGLAMESEQELREQDAEKREKKKSQMKKLMTAAPKAISLP